MQNTKNDKVWFAHMLRGIACLIVVFFHYCVIFWSNHERIVELSNVNQSNFPSNFGLLKLSSFLDSINLNLGSVGVGLFFIISGFVIPFSLNKTKPSNFLIKRFFRIIPPYTVGLFLTITTVFLYSKYYSLEFPYTVLDYIVNVSLLRDWFSAFGFVSIDGINWTLEVELKFYFICAFLTLISSLKNNKTLIVTSSSMLAIALLFSLTSDSLNIYFNFFLAVLTNSFFYLTYMFIGICFYNYFKKHWSLYTFIGTTSFLIVVSILVLYIKLPNIFNQSLVSYGFALIIFIIFYYLRNKLTFSPILNFFANISYSLYIVHGVVGYTLITVFYKIIPNPYLVIIIVFSIVVVLSYLLYKLIEMPSVKLGKTAVDVYKKNIKFTKNKC